MTVKRIAATPRVTNRSKPKPETLAEAADRIAAAAPVLGGLKHDLIEVARAAGAYRKTLMDEGFTQLETIAMVSVWHDAHWASVQDDEIADELEDA